MKKMTKEEIDGHQKRIGRYRRNDKGRNQRRSSLSHRHQK